MPATKNAVTRYYIIDKLLANRYHHYSIEDLLQLVNEELAEIKEDGVSRRTIELVLQEDDKVSIGERLCSKPRQSREKTRFLLRGVRIFCTFAA